MNQLSFFLLFVLGFPGGSLFSAPPTYRAVVETHPAEPVAGQPTHIRLRLTEAVESPYPLLGNEVPVTCQVTVQLKSAGGRTLLGPTLVPSQALQGEIFAIRHIFEESGQYDLVWSFHHPEQETQRHKVSLAVGKDPFGWVNLLGRIFSGIVAVLVLARTWRRTAESPRLRLKAVGLTVIFMALLMILVEQFIAPDVRHRLWESDQIDLTWDLIYTEFTDAELVSEQAVLLRDLEKGGHTGHFNAKVESTTPARPPRPGLATYLILLLVLAVAMAAVIRRKTWSEPEPGVDLLSWSLLYRVYRWKYFQPALWIPSLIVFGAVVYLGIWDTQVAGRNIATKLTWTIWWAAIIFAFVFAGKVWCTMCPFGALTIWTSRVFRPVRRVPRRLRNIWIANIAFVVITWADDFWGIVGSPRKTALLVILVALTAMVIGVAFQRATFCRHMCPIGGLIGLYSMFSGLELRAKDREVCRLCKGKECYQGTPAMPGCPMIQFPSTLDRNNYCTLCGDCVKTCPHANLALRIRPFGKDIWHTGKHYLDEAFMAIALVGLTIVVTGHMIQPWHGWMDRIAGWLPWHFLGVENHGAVEKWTFTFVYLAAIVILAPGLLAAASRVASHLARGRADTGRIFRTYAYMFIPVGIALHLAHNMLHLLKEGAGIVPVVQRTAAKYAGVPLLGVPNWNTQAPVSDVTIYWMQMTVLVVFFVASIYLGYRIAIHSQLDRKTALHVILPMVALSLGFTLLNIFLLSQPMAARHVH